MARLYDLDVEALRVAYMAGDAATFARHIAVLGIDLSLETTTAYLARVRAQHPKHSALTLLIQTIAQALVDDEGIAMRNPNEYNAPIALAKRMADNTIVVGVAIVTAVHRYGWPDLTRWHGEARRNRVVAALWATASERAVDALTIPILAPPARADRTEEELLAGVLADPSDDDARFVYADFLMEKNDPRGELIRLQCELANTLEPRDGPLRTAARRAYDRCTVAFANEVANEHHVVRRGFIDEVQLTAAAFSAARAKLFARHPIRRLAVRVPHHKALVKFAREVGELPSWIDHIEIIGPRNGAPASVLQLDDPDLAPLYERGGHLGIRNVVADEAAWVQALPRIRATSFAIESYVSVGMYLALANRSSLPGMTSLEIVEHARGEFESGLEPVIAALGARANLTEVRLGSMDLAELPVFVRWLFTDASLVSFASTDDVSDVIAASPCAISLRTLDCEIGDVELVVDSPHTANLVEISIEPNDMDGDLEPIGAAFARSNIRRVFVRNRDVPRRMTRLAPNVQWLDRARDGSPYLVAIR